MKLEARHVFLTINLTLFTILLYYLWFIALPRYTYTYYYEAIRNTIILVSILLLVAMVLSSILILRVGKEEEQEEIDIGKGSKLSLP